MKKDRERACSRFFSKEGKEGQEEQEGGEGKRGNIKSLVTPFFPSYVSSPSCFSPPSLLTFR